MKNELEAIDQYIYEQLAAQAGLVTIISTTGGAFKAFAEPVEREIAHVEPGPLTVIEAVEPPYACWSLLNGRDVNAVGRARILTRPFVLVRAVTIEPSYQTAADIANLIDDALHESPPATIDGVRIRGFDRQELYRDNQVIDGVRWNYVGGIYRGFVYSA